VERRHRDVLALEYLIAEIEGRRGSRPHSWRPATCSWRSTATGAMSRSRPSTAT
jgi:hypothetical protein